MCRSHRAGADSGGYDRLHESKGRLRRSIYNLLQEPAFNHQVSLFKGVLEEECSQMLKDFFRSLRTRLKT